MIESSKELRWIRLLLMVIALPVVVIILKILKSIFIPLIVAVFLSFVFAPLTSFLKRKHVPMWLILVITLVIIAIVFSLFVMIIYAASSSIVTGLPKYQHSFSTKLAEGTVFMDDLAKRLDIATQNIPMFDLSQVLSGSTVSLSRIISTSMNVFVASFWNVFLILIFMIFILLETGKLDIRLKKVMKGVDNVKTIETMHSIQRQIQNYLIVKTLISLATAFIGMGLMLVYGVDFVLVCGILLFVLNFIPNIGSIIASAIPICICFLQSGFDLRFIFFSLLIIATQMLFGNILEPHFQGNRQNLTPIMVLISLIFWGWLWGFVGMLICVPLTSGINIILKQIDKDNVVSALISSE